MTDMDEVNIGLPYELAMADKDSRREFYASAQAMLAAHNQVRADHSALWLRSAGLEREIVELRKDKDRIDVLEANGWDIRNYSSPIADTGDYSNAIEIVGRWMQLTTERGANHDRTGCRSCTQSINKPSKNHQRTEGASR